MTTRRKGRGKVKRVRKYDYEEKGRREAKRVMTDNYKEEEDEW